MLANLLSQRQHAGRGHRQFVKTDIKELLGQVEISAQFAADAAPDAMRVGRFRSHADHAENCRRMGVGETSEVRVLAVASERVLR